MKHSAPQSAKFHKLVRILRAKIKCESISIETIVVGILERLWHATISSAPRGDIGKIDDEVIAEMVGWHRDPTELIDSLVDVGFLDRCDLNRFVVHDWAEHAPTFIKGYLSRHNKEFAKSQMCEPNFTKLDLTQPNLTQPNHRNGGRSEPKQVTKQVAKQGEGNDLIPETLNTPGFVSMWKTYRAWWLSESGKPLDTIKARFQLDDLCRRGLEIAMNDLRLTMTKSTKPGTIYDSTREYGHTKTTPKKTKVSDEYRTA